MLIPLLLAAQVLGVAPGPLPKAEADRRVAERLADFDVNEDGAIERDEVRARFDLEASANAMLTAPQKKKATDPRAPIAGRLPAHDRADAWFDATDRDRYGKITRNELSAAMGECRTIWSTLADLNDAAGQHVESGGRTCGAKTRGMFATAFSPPPLAGGTAGRTVQRPLTK